LNENGLIPEMRMKQQKPYRPRQSPSNSPDPYSWASSQVS